MVSKRKIIIPIFNYHLKILIYDDEKELQGLIPDDALEGYFKGFTLSRPFESIVCINSIYKNTIAHESLHVVNKVWESIGYEPQRDNDEVSAYLLTYIYSKIMDVYTKHIEEKQ